MHTNSSAPHQGVASARPPGRRRTGAASVATLLALGLVPVLPWASPAHAAVTVGSNISVFPDRDFVGAMGYELGEQLLIEVLRDGVVIGTTQGAAMDTDEGVGLEVNHGPDGTPQAGECWNNFTPDIIGGDVVRVTTVDRAESVPRVDTMTVKDVAFTGAPVANADGTVSVSGTATPGTSFAVEFRRDKPDPRFRRGPLNPVFEAGTNRWTATFRPTATSAEGLTAQQQRQIAVNEASWSAVADAVTETTLAELGEPGGVGPGCTGSDDPNTLVGGLDPINIASGDVTFSGTARASVTAVSVTVGALGARDATVTPDPNGGPSTWTLTVPRTELATLPEGNVSVTPRYGTLAGATRTVLKDTVAPAAPTPSVAPGTYSGPQSVVLNKPAAESASKVYWEIGNSAVPDPTEFSNLYTSQINVTSTQTLKGRLFDAAGNPGAVGTFAYRIGTPPAAPTNLAGGETTPAGSARLTWSPASGATGYNVYRDGAKVNSTLLTGTAFVHTGAGLGDHSYTVRAAETNGIESLDSNRITVTIAAPNAPTGLRATGGDSRVTLNWTAPTGVANYRVYRDDVALSTLVAGSASSYTDSGRTNGTLYEYAIAALDSSGNESARTGVVQAVPSAPVAGDTTPPPSPTLTPASGTYSGTQTMTATSGEAGVRFRYTRSTSGSAPSNPSATNGFDLPAGGLSITRSAIVKVVAVDGANNVSPVVQRSYSIGSSTGDTTPPPAPTVNPVSGTYSGTRTMTAGSGEAGVRFRYTRSTSGSAPSNPSATNGFDLPAGGLSITRSAIVKVVAVDAANNVSPIVQRSYTINATTDTTPPPAPTVNPASGTYTGARTMTASSSEAGVRFRYTRSTSGSAPSNPSATNGFDLPAGGLSITRSAIVKVVAVDAANNVSPIVQSNYTIR